MKKNTLGKLGRALTLPTMLLLLVSNFYGLGINETDSLPYSLFIIKKGIKLGVDSRYLAFKKQGNKRYGDKTFVKMIGGRAGDIISNTGQGYFVSGKYVGTAKRFSLIGEEMELTQSGGIPEGHYFVYSLHKDSYDSKYKEFGLVAESDIIGVAYPIF